MKYDLGELIQNDEKFKKFQTQYYTSIKYLATTHRLKLSLEYLECSQERLKIKDIFIYKTCLEMAIITYSACFNNSKALLKISDKINNILNGNKILKQTHDKVMYYRDKVLAHQDKVDELGYHIDLLKNDDDIILEFPFLLKFKFDNNDQKNFHNLIIKVHDYLDSERQKHDKKFKQDLSEIL